MLNKLFYRSDVQFFSYGVFMPMVFASTTEPSKWVAVGCVAWCAIAALMYGSIRWAQGTESGLQFASTISEKAGETVAAPVAETINSAETEHAKKE
jgi:Ca2+/Na+ antiporter